MAETNFVVEHTVTITYTKDNKRKAKMTFDCRKLEGSSEMFIKLASNNQVSRLLGFPREPRSKYPMAKTKFISQMKHARDRLYTKATHQAIIDEEKVVLDLGDDEINTSTHPSVDIPEQIIEIDVPMIQGVESQRIKVVLQPPRSALEVMATPQPLTYLSKVLGAHVQKKLDMAALCAEDGEDEIVDDDGDDDDEDGADEMNDEVLDAD